MNYFKLTISVLLLVVGIYLTSLPYFNLDKTTFFTTGGREAYCMSHHINTKLGGYIRCYDITDKFTERVFGKIPTEESPVLYSLSVKNNLIELVPAILMVIGTFLAIPEVRKLSRNPRWNRRVF